MSWKVVTRKSPKLSKPVKLLPVRLSPMASGFQVVLLMVDICDAGAAGKEIEFYGLN